MVVITGEPGIGKTRLAEDFANRVRQGGDESLFGGCDRTAAVPLRAVLMALEPVIEDPRLVPLGSLLDDLRYLLGQVAHAAGSDEQLDERARRFTVAIGAALEALTCRGPVVLIVDDVQWADRSTLALLEHLATERSQIAALVVCTHRDTERESESRERFFVDLGRTAPVEWMALGALQPDEIRVLAELLTDAQPDAILTDVLRDASGGNPLHVVQLARLLTASGGVLPLSAAAISRRCCARVSNPSHPMRDPCSARPRSSATSSPSNSSHRCAAATRSTWPKRSRPPTTPVWSSPTGAFDRYRFVHGLVCQMIYDELDVSRRVRLHERAARALRHDGQELPIDAALHLSAPRRSFPSRRCSRRSSRAPAPPPTRLHSTLPRTCTSSRASSPPWTPPRSPRWRSRSGRSRSRARNHELGRTRLAAGETLARSSSRWDLVADTDPRGRAARVLSVARPTRTSGPTPFWPCSITSTRAMRPGVGRC